MVIRVYLGASNPTHDFSLSDGVQTWGLRLDGGSDALREEPLTPSTLRFSNAVSGFGSWEPGLAQIEQRDWSGGRGAARFSADETESARRFFDSMNAWTLMPGAVLPAPQWRLARGLCNTVQHLPGSVHWQGLFGAQRWLAARFTVGAEDLAPARTRVWLRRMGSPGALNLSLYEDEDGKPAAAIPEAGDVLTIADVPDVVSRFHSFDVPGFGGSLLAGIDYHVVLSASPSDNAANHWEIGTDKDRVGGHLSADGASWAQTKFSAYFRVEEAQTLRRFVFFQYAGGFYAADQRADGSPSHLYLNGDRGLATSGATAALEDAHKAWAADMWAGARVRILNGKGAGQVRRILSNSSMELVVEAWDQTPDASSEYVICAADLWRDISPLSGDLIDGVISDIALVNDCVLFAQGASVPILRMRFNAALAVPAHEFDDDGDNRADRVHVFHHSTAGPQVYRALAVASEVSRAAPAAWGAGHAFGAAIKVGDTSAPIHNLFDHAGQLWVLKADRAWTIDEADKAHAASLGLDAASQSVQRAGEFAGNLHFASGHALLEFSGSRLTDVGPNSGEGLPAGRQGAIAAMQPLGASRFALAVDAGSGESSVLVCQAGAWHELMRAPGPGQRILDLGLQECPGARARLWISLDGGLAFLDLPRETESPLADTGLDHQHEAALVTGTIDMGSPLLPKFLKQISLWSANMGRGARVDVDFQADGEIGGPRWRSAGSIYSAPLDSLSLGAGPLHAIRLRLRLQTDDAQRPPVVRASVLEGFARTPLKYRWSLRVRLADLQADRAGGLETRADEFLDWLQQAARRARKIQLRSIWPALDDKYVIVEPPAVQREYIDGRQWGGTATVVVREG